VTLFPPPWEEPGYSDIEGAERHEESIRVRFANGDVIELAPASIGITGGFEVVQEPDVRSALVVSTTEGKREIDWMVVRAATDPGFARVLRERDADESRRIGRRLKALRVNRGLSQKAAAALADMTPQQLANIEAGQSDMRLSTVRSLLRAMGAGFADIAGSEAPEMPTKELAKRASGLGIPRPVVDYIAQTVGHHNVPKALDRIFGPISGALLTGGEVSLAPVGGVRFKSGAEKASPESALVPLAQFLSKVVAAAAPVTAVSSVPHDPAALRKQLIEDRGSVTLDALLDWCWSAGIVVLPVRVNGAFAAAAWIEDGRPVIVLKDSRSPAVFWLFDLAHELGHIALGHVTEAGVVDGDLRRPDPDDREERAANDYALDLLVPDHAQLITDVRHRLRGKNEPENWKWDVKAVAEDAGHSAGLFATIAAFAMRDVAREQDRWGSAQNLARPEGEGRPRVERAFAEHVDLKRLPTFEALLVKALTTG
jgi:transcriptional regulator with XRE-family HTH domain